MSTRHYGHSFYVESFIVLSIAQIAAIVSDHSKSAGVADTTIADPGDQTATIVLHELERADALFTARFSHLLYRGHDHSNRMSATDSITRILEGVQPPLVTTTLARFHAFKIDSLD